MWGLIQVGGGDKLKLYSLKAVIPFLTFLSIVVATEEVVVCDIPPTLWCLEDSYT